MHGLLRECAVRAGQAGPDDLLDAARRLLKARLYLNGAVPSDGVAALAEAALADEHLGYLMKALGMYAWPAPTAGGTPSEHGEGYSGEIPRRDVEGVQGEVRIALYQLASVYAREGVGEGDVALVRLGEDHTYSPPPRYLSNNNA